MTTAAAHTTAARAALALAIILSCLNIHHHDVIVALLGLNDVKAVAVSLLGAVGLVGTVAVSAARHGDD